MAAGDRVSVFARLGEVSSEKQRGKYVSREAKKLSGHPYNATRGRSYCSVVKNHQELGNGVDRKVVELPPVNSEAKKKLEFKSLVGEAKDINILNNLKDTLEEGLVLRYLGVLKVLISFNSVKEADDYLRLKVEEWEKWFSRLYIWEGIPPVFERVAWIKVIGVPVSLWDRHILNKIGERCGRLLVKSEVSTEDGNMAEDRLAILVKSGKRVSEELMLTWKDHSLTVWVEEIVGQWSLDFLEKRRSDDEEMSSVFGDKSPELVSPTKSPEGEKSNVAGDEQLEGVHVGLPNYVHGKSTS
ncbi:hypothetical protein HanOQP8_Chr06g0212391 [Helianthus annuus]|nr:hypothetical protein HanOQP8_Chr06g0212391 [Helianthus annuus]